MKKMPKFGFWGKLVWLPEYNYVTLCGRDIGVNSTQHEIIPTHLCLYWKGIYMAHQWIFSQMMAAIPTVILLDLVINTANIFNLEQSTNQYVIQRREVMRRQLSALLMLQYEVKTMITRATGSLGIAGMMNCLGLTPHAKYNPTVNYEKSEVFIDGHLIKPESSVKDGHIQVTSLYSKKCRRLFRKKTRCDEIFNVSIKGELDRKGGRGILLWRNEDNFNALMQGHESIFQECQSESYHDASWCIEIAQQLVLPEL